MHSGPERFQRYYWLNISGKRIVYLYIRKNACSNFKKMFQRESEFTEKGVPSLALMSKHHVVKKFNVIRRAEHSVVVVRDPVERAFSAFANQLVAKADQATNIAAGYEDITGEDVRNATFIQFCDRYLFKAGYDLDGHFFPQSMHLLPFEHKHYFPLRQLHAKAKTLLGEEVAHSYFAHHVNSMQSMTRIGGNFQGTPVRHLFEMTKEGKICTYDSVVDAETDARL